MERHGKIKSWLELEDRFRKLVASLHNLILDYHKYYQGDNITREEWNLIPCLQKDSEFEGLCRLGGQMLKHSMSKKKEPGKTLLKEQNLKIRWYCAIKCFSDFRYNDPATVIEKDKIICYISRESLYNVVEVSANLCLRLNTDYPVKEKFWRRIYDAYGREIIIGIIITIIAAIIGLFLG